MGQLLPELTSVWAFLGLVLGFGFVIFIHELGHFLVAKWVGIKVTQFAVGFGQAVLCWRQGIGLTVGSSEAAYIKRVSEFLTHEKNHPAVGSDDPAKGDASSDDEAAKQVKKEIGELFTPAELDLAHRQLNLGETEYRLNWMPLGGYVKMLGQEDMDPTAQSSDERAYNCKPAWARACVLCAGVTMNLIFGFIFLTACFMIGIQFPPALVGNVSPDMPAAQVYAQGHDGDPAYYGLQTGDVPITINDQLVTDFMDLAVNTALASQGSELELRVRRAGEDKSLTYLIVPRKNPTTGLLSMGVGVPLTNVLGAVPKEGPYQYVFDAGVRADMAATAVNGQPISTFSQYKKKLVAQRGLPMTVTFTDPATDQTATVQLAAKAQLTYQQDRPAHLIGMVPAVKISMVSPDSPAKRAGMLQGDYIALLGDTPWPGRLQVYDIVQNAGKNKLKIAVLRDGQIVNLKATEPIKGKLGFMPGYEKLLVGQVLPQSPAFAMGISSGTRITHVNGQAVATWSDLQRTLQLAILQNADLNQADISLTYLSIPQDTLQTTSITQTQTLTHHQIVAIEQARWTTAYPSELFKPMKQMIQTSNVIEAAALGIKKTQQYMLQTYITLARLFQGSVKMHHLRGPVGIADEGTRIAKQGVSYLLFFLGVISINLVVINLLPIPITDGGLLVFLAIEKIKGSPVSPRVQTAAFFVGLALIVGVSLVTLYYDTGRLIN